jgi:hypothetical protein
MDMAAVKLHKLGAWSDHWSDGFDESNEFHQTNQSTQSTQSNRCVFIPRRSAQEYFYPGGKLYAAGSCGSGVLKPGLNPPFRR